MSGSTQLPEKTLAVNKKARFNYAVTESLECGIELKGTEVKSVKQGKFSFSDCYAKIDNHELWLIALHITPYTFGNRFNHDPDRPRKLLVHKQEIKRLKRKVQEKGLTLIPLRFYLKRSIVKLELGVCKGKKLVDKREDIKKRDIKRDLERELRDK
ncbi:MAG: SsrA-binding protein SmpB [Spirochaetales bacterium]|nr:SsrA-binding protein SmpB [Spirochaetales bacterium]